MTHFFSPSDFNLVCFYFLETVLLYQGGSLCTHGPAVSASSMLGLQACATTS